MKPKRRVMVCGRGECVDRQFGLEVEGRLNELIAEHGLDDPAHPQSVVCRLVNCLGVCMDGPIVMVHPEGVLYQEVGVDEAERIFNEHLLNDQPVEDYMHRQMRPKVRRKVEK